MSQEQSTKDATRVLIQSLEQLAAQKRKRGGVVAMRNTVQNSSHKITGWRFNDWDYASNKVKLPSKSRGLFTMGDSDIVCRGYDKFFSIDETEQTQSHVLAKQTQGPYYLTVKSNGCIAFISGLEDGTLVVCSKHSTGQRDDLSKNHALAAQNALESQLEKNGTDKVEFAQKLYQMHITIVCEYCDDEFEEHVLEYKGDKRGLYIHGINYNIPNFKTFPMEEVDEYALKYGFKRTHYTKQDTYEETIAFLEGINKAGVFHDEEIEGFVIRCKLNNEDFFFKYKFKEPYLLYRELREVTKSYLKMGKSFSIQNTKKKHKLICMDYIKFVEPLFEKDPKLAENFLNNKRVIELRKAYFDFKNTSALDIVNDETSLVESDTPCELEGSNNHLQHGGETKYILVTLATIGCGKTTTSLALQNLYPDLVGHVQNDNIQRPVGHQLVTLGLEQLMDKPIVILDKNNHKLIERKQIFDDLEKYNKLYPNIKVICLNFLNRNSNPKNDDNLWQLTRDRTLKRGDGHQSIQLSSLGQKQVESIMKGFISRFEKLNLRREPDSLFDLVIDLEVGEDSSFRNLKIIDQKLREVAKNDIAFPPIPSSEDYQKAFTNAIDHKPTIIKTMKGKVKAPKPKSSKMKKPYYFGVHVPPEQLSSVINRKLMEVSMENLSVNDKNAVSFSELNSQFHVTLFHKTHASLSEEAKINWDSITENLSCQSEDNILQDLPYKTSLTLKKLFISKRVYCCEVEIGDVISEINGSVEKRLVCYNKHPHITLFLSNGAKGVESNHLIEDYYSQKEKLDCQVYDLDPTKFDNLNVFVHY